MAQDVENGGSLSPPNLAVTEKEREKTAVKVALDRRASETRERRNWSDPPPEDSPAEGQHGERKKERR